MANSPWGKDRGSNRPSGGGSGGSTPPGGKKPKPGFDLDTMIKRSHEQMSGMFGGPGNERRLVVAILAIFATVWLASGVYRVNSDELGVVLRFGKYQRTTTSGLNYHLPYPVEQVIIPSVTSVNKVEIGSRSGNAENPNIRTAKSSYSDGAAGKPRQQQNREGLMLTADRNIVDIDFEVQWKVDATAPEKFLFSMRDPASSVHVVAESAMREVIGRHKLDEVLTSAQSQVAEETRVIMQQMLDSYDAGIEVIAVNLSRPDVPQPVIDEFQDVKRAQQDKQTSESVAEGYANQILPKAKGEAEQMLEQAAAYKSQVVADAEGDAARFNQIYAQYAQAKDVTRRRMYLETMEEVLKGMPKVILDQAGRGGAITQMVPVPVLRNAVSVAAPVTPATTAAIAAPAAQEAKP